MRSSGAGLTLDQLERFERHGFVHVREAFAPADARAMADRWWAELESRHGVRRSAPSTWRPVLGDLRAAKQDPLQSRILTGLVRGVLDDLLGQDAWSSPKDWGRPLTTFPEPGPWDVPTRLWHWDSPCELHLDRPTALFVVSFIGAVAPRAGGTLVLSGSHRLLLAQARARSVDPDRGRGETPWDRFHASDPWLAALTGRAASPADRVAAFMAAETEIDGVPLRVTELTGEPGDMVFCHPCLVHCSAPNRGAAPRFMRIKQQLLSHEGRDRLAGAGRAT